MMILNHPSVKTPPLWAMSPFDFELIFSKASRHFFPII